MSGVDSKKRPWGAAQNEVERGVELRQWWKRGRMHWWQTIRWCLEMLEIGRATG
jgi:hypothetical protein